MDQNTAAATEAEALAKATGARAATVTHERREADGTLTTTDTGEFHRPAYPMTVDLSAPAGLVLDAWEQYQEANTTWLTGHDDRIGPVQATRREYADRLAMWQAMTGIPAEYAALAAARAVIADHKPGRPVQAHVLPF